MTFRLGYILAVAFSNHSIYLTNAHTGKLMHQIDTSAYSSMQICTLGWGVNFAGSRNPRADAEKPKGGAVLDNGFSQKHQLEISDHLPDLPRDLAFLEVEEVLPRLSPLSSNGKE